MSSLVRIAIGNASQNLAWPTRCPTCGRGGVLVPSLNRVGRVKYLSPVLLGGISVRREVMYLSVPMCKPHAASNELANRVLQKSPLMSMARTLAYMLALIAVVIVTSLLVRGVGSVPLDLGLTSVLAIAGAAGCLVVDWAMKTASVRPVRADRDRDVIEVDFRDDAYADEFVRVNAMASEAHLAERPPWYRRAGFWRSLVLVGFVALVWAALSGL